MKKLLSVFLAVSLCLCACVSFASCGASAKFEFELSKDGSFYIITAINTTEKTEVLDIPSKYDGKPVKAIMSWTTVKNNNSSNLKQINIPNSIRFIKWLMIDKDCVVNFGDYTGALAPASTFDFPKQNNMGELDYNNLAPHTFHEFSLIIAGLGATDPGKTLTFPQNVIFAGSDVFPYHETVSFEGPVSTYQEGNGANGWDEVTTRFINFNRCKTVEIPEVAVGKGYNKINVHLPFPSGVNYLTEHVIVADSVRTVHFSAGSSGNGQLNLYLSGNDGFESTYGTSNPKEEFPTYLIKDYYYSETQPTDTSVTYWHYVDGVPTPW